MRETREKFYTGRLHKMAGDGVCIVPGIIPVLDEEPAVGLEPIEQPTMSDGEALRQALHHLTPVGRAEDEVRFRTRHRLPMSRRWFRRNFPTVPWRQAKIWARNERGRVQQDLARGWK